MPSPKPVVSIRRPALEPSVSEVNRFVVADAQTSGRPDASGSNVPSIVQRRDGRVRRRMTVYLPPGSHKS